MTEEDVDQLRRLGRYDLLEILNTPHQAPTMEDGWSAEFTEGEDNRSDGSTAAYYELPENAKELQQLISHRDMNAQIGEIFRSCYRYGLVSHSDKLRDAKKMRFYSDAEIKRLEDLV